MGFHSKKLLSLLFLGHEEDSNTCLKLENVYTPSSFPSSTPTLDKVNFVSNNYNDIDAASRIGKNYYLFYFLDFGRTAIPA